MMRAKIHGAKVTGADLHYEGSIGIDSTLLDLSGILVNERVDVWNRTNGKRFSTYAIAEKADSGIILVNGAAAHLVNVGDDIIIASFGLCSEEEAKKHIPKVVLISGFNVGFLKPNAP